MTSPRRPSPSERLSDRLSGGTVVNATPPSESVPDEDEDNPGGPDDASVPEDEIQDISDMVQDANDDAEGNQEKMAAAVANPTTLESDAITALRWAMHKLTHPSEQVDFCSNHGRVPITHVCSMHKNADYEFALRVMQPGASLDDR